VLSLINRMFKILSYPQLIAKEAMAKLKKQTTSLILKNYFIRDSVTRFFASGFFHNWIIPA